MHNIGLMGFGTVGTGVYEIINNHKGNFHSIFQDVQVTKILVRSKTKNRSILCDETLLTTNAKDLINNNNIHTLIFNLGGIEPSLTYMKEAMKNGKNVITANKAVVAPHLKYLTDLAEECRVSFLFEASTAGGIPIINPLKKQTQIDKINNISGILNGTCNYILSKMFDESSDFSDTLKDAQNLGFAEADPTDDIDGYDTARKISILSSIAYHGDTNPDDVSTRGIRSLNLSDIEFLKKTNYSLKLLGYSSFKESEYAMMAEPMIIPKNIGLAQVNGPFNQVNFHGSLVGDLSFTGAGAGQLPTATAIVSDLINILTNSNLEPIDLSQDFIKHNPELLAFSYYIRLSSISNISKEALLQKLSSLLNNSFEFIHEKENFYIQTPLMTRSKMTKIMKELSSLCENSFYAALLDSKMAVIS